MKKFLTLILALLYMGTATGATFHMHYCMGKLVEVALWHGENKKCSSCQKDLSQGCPKKCCKDEHKTIKLEKDQKAAEHATHFLQMPVAEVPGIQPAVPEALVVSMATAHPAAHAPPRSSKVPSHILHCSFRI